MCSLNLGYVMRQDKEDARDCSYMKNAPLIAHLHHGEPLIAHLHRHSRADTLYWLLYLKVSSAQVRIQCSRHNGSQLWLQQEQHILQCTGELWSTVQVFVGSLTAFVVSGPFCFFQVLETVFVLLFSVRMAAFKLYEGLLPVRFVPTVMI